MPSAFGESAVTGTRVACPAFLRSVRAKIPSMRMVDLAVALAPGCDVVQIGIRPGEKLHEVLVSEDEARHTVETEEGFVILPMHPWWKDQPAPNGRPLPDFGYEQLRNMVNDAVAKAY